HQQPCGPRFPRPFFRQNLAGAAGPGQAPFPPVGVPVGPVGAAGAAGHAAANGLPAIADLTGAAADYLVWAQPKVAALDEEAPDEDHQAPQVVLVEGADLPDEAAVEAHAGTLRPRLRWRPPGRSAPR